MNIAVKLVKRYSFFLITVAILLLLLLFNRELGKSAVVITGVSLRGMATIIFPIFILLGLLDVWVSRETMMKYMGDGSGIKGVLLAVFLGSAAAGPLYGAFPVAAVLMRKGVKFSNILIFIGAWSTTKIPLVLFEMNTLGVKFALTRLAIDIPGIIIMALIIGNFVKKQEVDAIYLNAENM